MSKALILNGSPRGNKSTSASLGAYLHLLFENEGVETSALTIRKQLNSKEKIAEIIEEVKTADFVILFAPLYDDSQPYIVTKIMEIIAEKKMNLSNKTFIPIVNCGFPEPEQISEVAIPIYQRFALAVGFKWGGSLAIGGGEMLRGRYGMDLDEVGNMAKNAKEALRDIVGALIDEAQYPNTEIILIPRIFYKWPLANLATSMNNKAWKKMVERKGEKVDAQPYLEE